MRVLPVDPEHRLQPVCHQLLRVCGYTIAAQDEPRAEEIFFTHNIDILFTNYFRSAGNGDLFLETVHRRLPQIPVLVMTKKIDEDAALAGAENGTHRFVSCQIEPQHFLISIARAQEKRKNRTKGRPEGDIRWLKL